MDRLVFAELYRLAPTVLNALRDCEAGDRHTMAPGRLQIVLALEVEASWWPTNCTTGDTQGEMSIANPLWGAPRIHGELLKLGIDVGQTSVARYIIKRREPPSQGWKTFLHNHADGIAEMDLFVVPTISFRLLYGLLIIGHGRRQILFLPLGSCDKSSVL